MDVKYRDKKWQWQYVYPDDSSDVTNSDVTNSEGIVTR